MSSQSRAPKCVRYQVDSPPPGFSEAVSSSASHPSTPIDSDGSSECAVPVDGRHYARFHWQNRRVSIDMLPDDALLEVFKCYVDVWDVLKTKWHTLAHVCRRWRYVVLASPRHLELQLVYAGRRPVTKMPDIWPTLPIAIRVPSGWHSFHRWSRDNNIIAFLDSKHQNRISQIDIHLSRSVWDKFTAVMQKPFPELTDLYLMLMDDPVSILPDSFLGGSAPRLRRLSLETIPFPTAQKILLSANNLVYLCLRNIPDSGYISPEDMATSVSSMTRLKMLILRFRSSRLHTAALESRSLPPLPRFILPALTWFDFQGMSTYLERFVARIDAPALLDLGVVFFHDVISDVPQLHRFISHAEKLSTLARATASLSNRSVRLTLSSQPGTVDRDRTTLALEILHNTLGLPLSSLAQVCNSSLPLLSTLEQLDITGCDWSAHLDDNRERMQWQEFLSLFTSLKDLHLSKEIALPVIHALKELSREREKVVLPTLRNFFIQELQPSGPVQEAVERLIAAREVSNHRVAVHNWKR